MARIRYFKESRDKLLHHKSHLGLSTTSEGKLGYDVVGASDDSWERNTVKDIFEGLQDVVSNLSDLLKYLSRNLPSVS